MRKSTRRSASPTVRALADERRRQAMAQTDIADAIGTSQPKVSAWEIGKTTPSILFVEEMAAALGYRLVLVPLSETSEVTTDKAGQ